MTTKANENVNCRLYALLRARTGLFSHCTFFIEWISRHDSLRHFHGSLAFCGSLQTCTGFGAITNRTVRIIQNARYPSCSHRGVRNLKKLWDCPSMRQVNSIRRESISASRIGSLSVHQSAMERCNVRSSTHSVSCVPSPEPAAVSVRSRSQTTASCIHGESFPTAAEERLWP